MPITLNPYPNQTRDVNSLSSVKYRYSYPLGLNLRPGTKTHDNLRDAVLERARLSHSAMSPRYSSWQDIDASLTSYIPLSDSEQTVKNNDSTKPVSTIVPLSFATLETLLAYLTVAFLEEPIFRYRGFGDEDVLAATLLQYVIELQTRKTRAGLVLHTMFRDALAYGFGVITAVWDEKRAWRREKRSTSTFSSFLNKFVTKEEVIERVSDIVYEGNKLINIDPYKFFPDTNVAIQDIQEGEYVGWLKSDNLCNLMKTEAYDENFFNVKYLQHITGQSVLGSDESERDRYNVMTTPSYGGSVRKIDVIYMYIDLIPKEWGIGRSNQPEKWAFAVAGDSVVVSAHPLGLDHNLFPVVVCAPDYDGYTLTPISRLETTYGMEKYITFLFNSHMQNVRKAIHDMFLVDPDLININDLLNPKPGKLIRLRRKVWGRGVAGAMEQLKVSDVTSGHIVESAALMRIFDRVSGAEDVLQGNISGRKSERVSATEFQGTKNAALSRLEKHARIAGLQAINPLAEILASHTQQFMTKEQYIEIAGEEEERLRKEFGDVDRVLVGPMDIISGYNIVSHDGTLPTSGDPQLWLAMIQMIGANPTLMNQFNVINMFKHWARISGAKNLSRFINNGANVTVVPDEEVEKEVQAGNIVPMEEEVASGEG